MGATIDIGGRRVGSNEPVFVVAELSGNHRGDYGRAVALVQAAAEAGADAVKLQTYTADTLTIDSDNEWFRIGGTGPWAGRMLYDLYREAATPWEWQPRLKTVAEDAGVQLFSSPFDAAAVAFLEEMDVPAYKIASFELTDASLLETAAATGKPVIVSTGMASLEEIGEAIGVLRRAGAHEIALLKCTSAYPAPPGQMNLRALPRLAGQFDVVPGLSDHTLSETVAVGAVALGACIIEKHLTLCRSEGGPDAPFSIEPAEFSRLVHAVRETETALGSPAFGGAPDERDMRPLRRSLFVVADVHAGDVFTPENIRSIRPGHGLAPKHLNNVVGRRAVTDIERGTPLTWDMIAP